MRLRKEHFNKRDVDTFHSNQFCDYCGYRFNNKEICHRCDTYYKEDLKICENCYNKL